jgi:hypothetical protein
LAVGNNTEA